MELENYIFLNKDSIHSALVEVATKLAAYKLMVEEGVRFDELIEKTQENQADEAQIRYKENYQLRFEKFYDQVYARIAGLIKFDVAYKRGIVYEKEKILCEEIASAVNGSFCFRAFAESIGQQHRTIQQLFFRLMQTTMLYMASGAISIDDRNRASYELCVKIEQALKNHHLPMI